MDGVSQHHVVKAIDRFTAGWPLRADRRHVGDALIADLEPSLEIVFA